MNWILDEHNETGFLTACTDAVNSDLHFASFRRNPFFKMIVENSPLKSGLEYYQCIKKEYPWILDYRNALETNDKFGAPEKYNIGDLFISPSTLRYVKTVGDLTKFFGPLDRMCISEIGAGYGGLCALIQAFFEIDAYWIYDQPEPQKLQQKFVAKTGRHCSPVTDICVPHGHVIDLLIAMYSWSELTHDHQIEYMEKVMRYSRNLYIMLNYDMDFSYDLIKKTFPSDCISDHNLFYDDANTEYAPYNRFIIIKNNPHAIKLR